jgi:hypothetical protein
VVLVAIMVYMARASEAEKSKNFPGSRFWWTKNFRMKNACFYKQDAVN